MIIYLYGYDEKRKRGEREKKKTNNIFHKHLEGVLSVT